MDCSPAYALSPTMASGGGSGGGGGAGGLALGASDGCEASPLFLSSSFELFETELLICEASLLFLSSSFELFETELLIELELLSGSAVSAVGVDDLSET